jgi:uncharacterized protein (DUF2147 family)
MSVSRIAAVAALGALALASTPLSAQAPATGVDGTWVNPHGSVKVKTGPCGDKLCGWVVWASPQALKDASDSGVAKLIGTELLQDYHSTGQGKWQGRVYVPDMGRSYYSTIQQEGPNSLKISGCILGGWICKSQIWQRA